MPRRISRIIRRARTGARERGLPVDRVMPFVEAAIGLLVGLALGSMAWMLFRGSFVEYRYTTLLEVSVKGERHQAAAETIATFIRNPEGGFHREWLLKIEDLGLSGNRRLWADVQEVSERYSDERTAYAVRIMCEGRPGSAARDALAQARDQIRKHTPVKLKPVSYQARMERLAKKILEGEQETSRLKAGRARIQASEEESAERGRKQAELDIAGRAYEAERKILKPMLPAKKRLKAEEAELRKKQNELADVEIPGPSKLVDMDDERRELSDRLKDTDRTDCSAEHPIERRIRKIDRIRRASALPGLITRVKIGLDKVAAQERKVNSADEQRAKCQEALDKINAKYADKQRKRDDLDEKIARLRTAVNDAKAKQASLKSDMENAPSIAVGAEEELKSYAPPYGYAFYLGGMLIGLLGSFVVHRKVLPAFSRVEDEVDLADALRMPVLGKVPRLAMLSKP